MFNNLSYKNIVFLNSARNCLRYFIKQNKIKQIYIPYYICQSVRYAIKQENISLKFYHIDKNFMPDTDFEKTDYILYPNYFGICSSQNKILSDKYKYIISDNAHAFFAEKSGCAAIYSPRKFINVNDGGILISDNISENIHLSKDDDRNIIISDYESFCKNEISLDNQDLKIMSLKTKKILFSVNEEEEKANRINLFKKYDNIFSEFNNISFELNENDIPYVYPLQSDISIKIGDFINKNGAYTLKYSTNFPKNYPEYELTKNILLLPLKETIYNICSNAVKLIFNDK